MSAEDRTRWDAKYVGRALPSDLTPDDWLREHLTGRSPGRALDLACGLGQNAVWLASRGWTVDAVDVSPVSLELARQLAQQHGQSVNWIEADLDDYAPPANRCDLILVFRFLERDRLPRRIVSALRPGGLLLSATFLADTDQTHFSHRNQVGPRQSEFLLQPGELSRLFSDLCAIESREVESGGRRMAQLAAVKPIESIA